MLEFEFCGGCYVKKKFVLCLYNFFDVKLQFFVFMYMYVKNIFFLQVFIGDFVKVEGIGIYLMSL